MENNDFEPTGPAWESAAGICEHPHLEWFSKGDSIVVMAEGFDTPLKLRVFEVDGVVLARRTIQGMVHTFMGCPTGFMRHKIDSAKPWKLLSKRESRRRTARRMTREQLDDLDAQVVETITEYFNRARVRFEEAHPEGGWQCIPEAYGVPYPDAGLIVNELTCNRGMIHGAHFAGNMKAKQAAVRRSIARLMKRGVVDTWTDEDALFVVEVQRAFENQ